MDCNMTVSVNTDVTAQPPVQTITAEKMLSDTDWLLEQFAEDYRRMAE